jgi:hypothetical protein
MAAPHTAGRNAVNSAWNGWVLFWRTGLPNLWKSIDANSRAITQSKPN